MMRSKNEISKRLENKIEKNKQENQLLTDQFEMYDFILNFLLNQL